jgi:hypothetical protein
MLTKKELQSTINNLARKVERLEKRLSDVEDRLQQETLHSVRTLAEADNEWPNSYSGFVRMMDRCGAPRRTRGGSIKDQSTRQQTTYVSMYDLEKKC